VVADGADAVVTITIALLAALAVLLEDVGRALARDAVAVLGDVALGCSWPAQVVLLAQLINSARQIANRREQR
jgi:hypothetical protein